MIQYEYHILDLRHGVEDNRTFERLLNDLGAQGWLLVLETGDDLIFVRTKKPISSGPVKGVLSLKGEKMGLTVDTTPGSESLTLDFEDDKRNETGAPTGDGSGLVVTLTSGDEAVATVGATAESTDAAGNPVYTASITVVTTVPATASFGATVANTSGAALMENDGATPFPPVDSISVPVTAGAPVAGSLSVAP